MKVFIVMSLWLRGEMILRLVLRKSQGIFAVWVYSDSLSISQRWSLRSQVIWKATAAASSFQGSPRAGLFLNRKLGPMIMESLYPCRQLIVRIYVMIGLCLTIERNYNLSDAKT